MQNIAFTTDMVFIEGVIYRLILIPLSLSLFIFWRKRNALLMYQAWALFHLFMSILLLYQDFFRILSGAERIIVNAMFFLNNLIIVWRSWQISEKYMPKKKLAAYAIDLSNSRQKKFSGNIISRFLALWATIKHGGNDNKHVYKIKKSIGDKLK